MSFATLFKPSIFINTKKYKIIDQIGEGGFAFVYKVISVNKEDHNVSYALKKMICQTDEQMLEAKKEIELMTNLIHPNILSLLDHTYSINNKGQNEAILLMPLMMYSLQYMIDQGPGFPYCCFNDGLDVLKVLRHCIDGIAAIHAYGIRHADLKPANILLDENYHAVITDFGSASKIPHVISTRSEALIIQDQASQFTTASYRAPELFNTPSDCILQGESDIWSLGCIIFSIFFSRSPFETPTEGLSTLSVLSAQYHIPDSNIWPQEYLDLISNCLIANPSERMLITDLELSLRCINCPPLDIESLQSTATTITNNNNENNIDMFSTSAMSTTIDTITSYGTNQSALTVSNYDPTIETTNVVVNRNNDLSSENFADFNNNEATYVTVEHSAKNELPPIVPPTISFEETEKSLKLSDFQTSNNDISEQSIQRISIVDINNDSTDDFGDFTAVNLISNSSKGGSIDELSFSNEAVIFKSANTATANNSANLEQQTTPSPPSKIISIPYNPSISSKGDRNQIKTSVSSSSSQSFSKRISFLQSDNTPLAEIEVIDLWQQILLESESCHSSSSSCVIKEGPVYMLRYGGFPKKLIKKQIWLVLTKSGLVLRKEKDFNKSKKVFEIVSLQKGIYMTHSDTMNIGLNGLSIQGSSPISIYPESPNNNSVNDHKTSGQLSNIQEEWVKVIYLTENDNNINNYNNNQNISEKVKSEDNIPIINNEENLKKCIYKSKFKTCIFEISFENKEIMNDWMDCIEMQRDIYIHL